MSTSEIIQNQKKEISNIINQYIDKYLELCESEIEKLFFVNLFLYVFKCNFDNSYSDTPYFTQNISFHNFKSIGGFEFKKIMKQINSNRKPTDGYYVQNEIGGIVGIELSQVYSEWNIGEDLKINRIQKYIFIPQFVVELPEKYRIDIALLYINQSIDEEELIFHKKIAIECDGYEFHSSKEDLNRDNIRNRKLISDGWTVLRYSGTEIYNNTDFNDIERILREIHHIISSSKK